MVTEHGGSPDQVLKEGGEQRPDLASLELSDGRAISREQQTTILRLLIENGVLREVKEGETYSLDRRRTTGRIEAVSILEDEIVSFAWLLDDGVIVQIENILKGD